MLVAILFLCAGVAAAAPPAPVEAAAPRLYYHESVGVPEAARILHTEEAGARIVGGAPSALGAYPFLVGLVVTLTTGATSVCGGTLLTNTRALTAAHCWWDGRSQARQFEVVLGSRFLFTGGVRILTSHVDLHENWNTNTLVNNIAIVVFPWVAATTQIRAVTLPTAAMINNTFAGTWAVGIGYGINRDGAGIVPNQVQHAVSMAVITNAVCQQSYLASRVPLTTMCTNGAGGVGICGGDTGGPLVNGLTLIGVASWNSELGCQAGRPSVFTRVTSFDAWIRARI